MGDRPLRQYYDGVTIVVDDELDVVDPWLRHRRRLLGALEALSEEQWMATTRCTSWDARGVVSHLVTVDAFWTGSVRGALAGTEPTTFIRGFDPSTGTDAFVDPMLELPIDAILGAFVDSTDAFVAAVDALDDAAWDAPGEAPFGHLAARWLLAHAFWDSWLHERDILLPLGIAPEVEHDDLLAATWYTLVVGALQGGLLDDPTPVGPGPDGPVDVTVRFRDLPGDPLRVQIGTGVTITAAGATDGVDVGSALALVEIVTGRADGDTLDTLPADLAAQLRRAALIL